MNAYPYYILFVTLVITAFACRGQPISTEGTPPPTKIYRVQQADGSTLYTDSPEANSRPVDFDAETLNLISGATTSPPPPNNPKPKPLSYQVVITRPQPDATLRNNVGEITIVAHQPSVPKASRYRLVFNGASIQSNTTGIFQLTGIHRGEHQFKVELTDNKGKTLASSAVQTLFLHQASVLINNP